MAMHWRRLILALGVVGVVVGGAARGDVVYQLDDGTGSVNSGPVFAAPEFMWGNVYTAEAGGETIESISVAFGKIEAGRAMHLYVYADPTADHDPRDAVMLLRQEAVTDPKGGNVFTSYAIEPTVVEAGMDFFVAVSTSVNGTNSDLPARLDPQGAANADRAWFFASDGFDKFSLGEAPYAQQLSAFALPAVVMVRAVGVPGVGTGVVALVGVGVGCLRRRRRE